MRTSAAQPDSIEAVPDQDVALEQVGAVEGGWLSPRKPVKAKGSAPTPSTLKTMPTPTSFSDVSMFALKVESRLALSKVCSRLVLSARLAFIWCMLTGFVCITFGTSTLGIDDGGGFTGVGTGVD